MSEYLRCLFIEGPCDSDVEEIHKRVNVITLSKFNFYSGRYLYGVYHRADDEMFVFSHIDEYLTRTQPPLHG